MNFVASSGASLCHKISDAASTATGRPPCSLFWISVFILAIQTYVASWERNGFPLSLAFATLFSKDAKTLALSDAVLVAATALCVPFAKAISKGWIRYYYTGVIMHHTFQALLLGAAVTWTFNRQWPWVQSGFFSLHAIVMIMKVHSYCAVNGYLQHVYANARKTEATLKQTAEAICGSYEIAIAQAAAADQHVEFLRVNTASTTTSSLAGTPPESTDISKNLLHAPAPAALRSRLSAEKQHLQDAVVSGLMPPGSLLGGNPPPHEDHSHPLVHHPAERISRLAKTLTALEAELTGTVTTRVRWPANISLRNFADYQLIPCLVYELEYPRTERIRPFYVLEKTIATFGTFALLYTVTEHSIMPLTPPTSQPFWRSLLDLSLPFMTAYLLLFYLIFDCVCNGFAELSRYADRRFYDDWYVAILNVLETDGSDRWNSTSMDEFSRKWNRPVHTFLLRHVYTSTMSAYKLSRNSATMLTFLLSALVHELVMAIVTKKIRMYLFAMQMIQIPMIAVGRIPVVRRNKILGNVVFWLGLYMGFPLLCVAYCAY